MQVLFCGITDGDGGGAYTTQVYAVWGYVSSGLEEEIACVAEGILVRMLGVEGSLLCSE